MQNRYKIETDNVIYDGPTSKKMRMWKFYRGNLTLTEAIELVKKEKVIDEIDIDFPLATEEDKMGGYTLYKIVKDNNKYVKCHNCGYDIKIPEY